MCHDVMGCSQGNHKRISFSKYTSAVFSFLSGISKDIRAFWWTFLYTVSFLFGGHPFLHSLFFPPLFIRKTSFIINTRLFVFYTLIFWPLEGKT